jgi:RNA polymerase sigma factor (sigma-70 family)
MEQPEVLADLIDQFARAVEDGHDADLGARESQLRERLTANALDPAAPIGPQGDEFLVRALQKEFFFDEVYNEIFARYWERVRGYLMSCGVEYHRAADLAQELFLICARTRLHRFDPSRGKLASYLLRAARHLWVSKDLRRATPRITSLFDTLAASGSSPSDTALSDTLAAPGGGPPDITAAREMEERFRKEAADLPAEQRAVLELVLDGHGHAEIAKRLGITPAASQMRLFKARQTLAARLGFTRSPTNLGRPRRNPPPSNA